MAPIENTTNAVAAVAIRTTRLFLGAVSASASDAITGARVKLPPPDPADFPPRSSRGTRGAVTVGTTGGWLSAGAVPAGATSAT